MNETAHNIISRIDRFIKRYHQVALIKGLIDFVFCVICLLGVTIFIEYYLWLSVSIKTLIWYLLPGSAFLCFAVLILIPFLRSVGILKKCSREIAVKIISHKFPEIRDHLINAFELIQEPDENNPLISASIKQKSLFFKHVDFNRAVDFSILKRSVYRVIPLLLTFLIGFSFFKTELLLPAKRLYHYDTQYNPPLPYRFLLANENMVVKKGGDIDLKVKVVGKDLPQVVYLNIHGQKFLMKTEDQETYSYLLKNISRDLLFSFTDGNLQSDLYRLKVLPVPEISSFNIHATPPPYTRLSEIVQENDGNLVVPQGSVVRWDFTVLAVDSLALCMEDDTIHLEKSNEIFSGSFKILKDREYSILSRNEYFEEDAQLRYQLKVVPDLHPAIEISEVRDSINYSQVYFHGLIHDDYGFSKLKMVLSTEKDSLLDIPFQRNIQKQEFYYFLDFNIFKEVSSTINYSFEVWDNDGIHGAKKSSTPIYTFHFPSEDELMAHENKSLTRMEDFLSESRDISQKIQDKLQEIKEKSIRGELSDWEKRQMVEDIVSQKQALENMIDKASDEFKQNNQYQNSFSEQEKELVDKQEQIQELLDQVLSDELKELLDQFNELAQQFDEEKFNNLTRDIDLSMDDLSMQLDRNLEMLRKLQIERGMENLSNHLDILAEDEEKESREIKSGDEGIGKNRENRAEFQQLMDQLDDLQEKNNQLKHPFQIDSFQEDRENINDRFKRTEELLQQRKKNKASKEMQQNSSAKQKLASQMRNMMKSSEMQMKVENIEALEMLLYNLVQFSFHEEEVMMKFRNVTPDDPKFRTLSREQKITHEQWDYIRDSLYTLAERSPVLSQDINREIVVINSRLGEVEKFLPESMIGQARGSLQYIMTSANNLALLIDEVIKATQKAMENAMAGSGGEPSENQKGGGMPDLKQAMEGFREQLQQMINQMKDGQGQKGGKEFGKMLRQQEMLQQMLQKFMGSGQAGGDSFKKLSEIQNLLDKTRKELINQNVSVRTLERQHQIKSRLLEAENAMMERDRDDKRKSKTAKEEFFSNPSLKFEKENNFYKFMKFFKERDLLLNQYYDQKYLKYLKNLKYFENHLPHERPSDPAKQ